ncbi:hypothetical protein MA16_Dca018105 [Dendrobium catenatum]|uniref:Uncharacterized protein n=1 Tax=Dendrobium catenatum TaxID=906689 RepID=A0A2I0WXT9_9ASPA|nr:hypothetical protein MA16_Dca018105 [Dendrobium catenatum]
MCSCASSSKGVSRKPRLGSGSCRAAGKDVAIYGPWAMDLVKLEAGNRETMRRLFPSFLFTRIKSKNCILAKYSPSR